jgi:FAD/FMN-containing dehydrogenase
VRACCVEDIVAVVKDTRCFPGPVRAKGSHHSTTKCIVAEGGTVLDMTGMNRIVCVDAAAKTITMEAGVLLLDAAKELEQLGLQFYVNIELGNLTVGSGACCGTKEASYYSSALAGFEYGQVCSYVVGYKLVQADGSLLEVLPGDATRPELLAALRSSYGMLGVIYEVTYRVKELSAMAFAHEVFTVDEFARRLDQIVAPGRSSMLYLFPFLDRVVVEYRRDNHGPVRTHWQWKLRNWLWETLSPAFGKTVSKYIPCRGLRYGLVDAWSRLTVLLLRALSGKYTSPADQIIDYPEKGGYAAYTFSIWAFDKNDYPRVMRAYFEFCREYYRRHRYRCDMLNVGYALEKDESSLFSYTRRGFSLTLDPVSTGGPGWDEYLRAFNEFCSANGGKPLFNQTPHLTHEQAQAAFAPEIAQFQQLRRASDPHGRFYTPWFQHLFEGGGEGDT